MSKIRDTLSLIQSGARNNKYRLLFPLFGQEIDILCHSSSNPGREIGTVEVYLKGRKYQMAGDMSEEGSWTITIYNTEDFLVRSFFLKVIAGIQNFNTPVTLNESYNQMADVFQGFNYSGIGNPQGGDAQNIGPYDFLTSIGKGDLSDVMNTVNSAYNDMRSNWESVSRALDNVQDIVRSRDYMASPDGKAYVTQNAYNGDGNYIARPWYMTDIVIQQLDHNDSPVSETRLNNAFASVVGGIDYTDEAGEISTTEITFTYSGTEYGVVGDYVSY